MILGLLSDCAKFYQELMMLLVIHCCFRDGRRLKDIWMWMLTFKDVVFGIVVEVISF